MTESMRVGYAGNVEIHLKRRLHITNEIVSSISTLPSSEEFYVITKNTNTGDWLFGDSFNDLGKADQKFITLCDNNGLSGVNRLAVGGTGKSGRVIGK